MNEDRFAGAATNIGGKIEKTLGDVTGDAGMKSEGLANQAMGTAQNLYGTAKDAVDTALNNASPLVRNGVDQAVGVVKAHPVLMAMVAGAVGYAVALSINSSGKNATR